LTIQNKQGVFEQKEAKETKTNLGTSILKANNRASDLMSEVMKELSALGQPFAYDYPCDEGSVRFRISGAPKCAGDVGVPMSWRPEALFVRLREDIYNIKDKGKVHLRGDEYTL
jgi:hypothetical protein